MAFSKKKTPKNPRKGQKNPPKPASFIKYLFISFFCFFNRGNWKIFFTFSRLPLFFFWDSLKKFFVTRFFRGFLFPFKDFFPAFFFINFLFKGGGLNKKGPLFFGDVLCLPFLKINFFVWGFLRGGFFFGSKN